MKEQPAVYKFIKYALRDLFKLKLLLYFIIIRSINNNSNNVCFLIIIL